MPHARSSVKFTPVTPSLTLSKILRRWGSATCLAVSSTTSWKQTFTFDRYGNRRFDEANTDTLASGCATAVCNPTIDPATNKLIGYVFDSSGNTKTDANNRTFIYDAENKQIEVKDSSGNRIGEYFYDGDGKRVKKVEYSSNTPVQTTIFIYDASGKMVAEYETEVAPVSTAQVSYLTSDHLGSPRITTDKDGKVFSRRDFMPFGEEITSEHTVQRDTNLNYGEDGIRQKFTSYERDNETDLDFAQARMYANKLGRFTGVDLGPFTLADPQNWNRYIYTLNNPLKFTDPSGNEIYLNGNAADDFLDFLAEKSGYELEKDPKTGKVSIKKGSKRNEKGTSKKFANLLKTALGKGFKLNYEVKSSDSGGVLFDNGENATVDRSKKTIDAVVDFEDIKITDQLESNLATAVTAHFLFEHVEMAKNGKPFTGDTTNGLKSTNAGAHVGALIFEAEVLSELTNSNDKIREAIPQDMTIGGKARYEFIYDSVQYDVYLKSTSTNGATVDRIVKKAPTSVPTYNGKRP